MLNAFKMADEVLLQGVSGHHRPHHHARPDQHRLRRREDGHANAGSALMGIGRPGEGRALSAAKAAISSPLLEAIEGARGILLNISGPSDLGLFEVNEAAEIIHGVAHPDANIIFGTVIDDEMGDEVRVTVIAAGFDRLDEKRPMRPDGPRTTSPPDHETSSVSDDDDDLGRRRRRRLRRPVVPV
jgi:cell division protein FtsZ